MNDNQINGNQFEKNNSNFNVETNVVTPSNNNQNRKNHNVKLGMYKNENDMSHIMLRRVLIFIIVVLVGVIIFLLVQRKPKEIACPCDNETFTEQLEVSKTVNKELGLEMYYKVRNVYEDFALDTSRICGAMDNSTLVDNYFMKSSSPKFKTYTDLSSYVRGYFYGTPASTLLSSSTFKNKDGSLYCVYSTRVKNPKYIELEDITLEDIGANKLVYTVKEKYFAQDESTDCLENCKYDYNENVFILEKINGRWLVSDFTLPY